eukprot:COSAG01_NODE_281_length_19504_cov_129.173124_26_plen_65_part_00
MRLLAWSNRHTRRELIGVDSRYDIWNIFDQILIHTRKLKEVKLSRFDRAIEHHTTTQLDLVRWR